MSGPFKIETDAGETINVSRNALVHVEKQVMQRIRPSKFRKILQVDSSIPWWVESAEYDMVQQSAQWIAAEDGSSDFATASTQLSKEGFQLVEMVSGYRYRNRELVRAQKMGMRLDAARADAVMKKAETVLDHIAANGTTNGVKSLGQSTVGLYNVGGITPLVGGVTATAYEDLPFGTADEQDAFVEAVVADALAMERKAEVDTKETGNVDTLVLPLSFATFMTRTKSRGSEMNIEDLIVKRARHIERVEYWHKAETYGAGGLRRMVALASKDKEAARFVLSRSPVAGRSFQTVDGVATPVNMVVGGFNTKLPQSLVYMDAAALTP